MSVFCSSSSTSRSIVSKIAPPQLLSFLYPIQSLQGLQTRRRHQSQCKQPVGRMVTSTSAFEACFFNSLISAGHCRKHNSEPRGPCTFFTSQRPNLAKSRRPTHAWESPRRKHTLALPQEEAKDGGMEEQVEWKGVQKEREHDEYWLEANRSKDELEKQVEQPWIEPSRTKGELMELVDQYSGWSNTDEVPLLELPNRYQPSDGPHLTVSDKVQDEWPPPQRAWPANEETKVKIKALESSLKDFSNDPEELYLLYRSLPGPRVPYLESKTRHKLLRHLAVVEHKNEHSMIRYLSVVDDMKVTAIPLSSDEWTSAISFASRYVLKSTEVEVESALHMWREMEHVAGVKASDSTFNVLFDVACKAGKFTLAEMIYKEMRARGLEYTRYHHVSQIHYHGLRGDGDGARASYKDLIDAGEMVDTVVLNAMISALVRAHEAGAAENTYERMKRMHLEASKLVLPPRNYKDKREITKALMKMAKISKADPSKRENLQRRSCIAPDLHTYRILINYFAVQVGDLDKAARLLDEMKLFEIPIHGALFLALFKGFAIHGGVRYTEWDDKKLESVWEAFMEALGNKTLDLHISRWMARWALGAFAKCSGKSRTIEIWEQMKGRWEPGAEDLDFVLKTLREITEGEDSANKQDAWIMGAL